MRGTNVVTIQSDRIRDNDPKIINVLPNLDSLNNSITKSTVLSLDGGFGDGGLLRGMPGNQVGTKDIPHNL